MKYALGNMLNGAGGLNADQLALDLQFAADKTLTARKGPTPILTRASTGTFVGSNGLIQTMGAGLPRFDHDPVTLASRGLLIEESRTNLLQRSEEFGNVYWTTTRASITTDVTTSPDGLTTAEKLIADTTASSNHRVDRPSITLALNTVYTVSIFAKAGEYTGISLGVGLSATQGVNYSLVGAGTATPVSGSGHTGTIQQLANGWYRCTATFTSDATTASHRLAIYAGQNGTTFTYTGDNTSGIFIWGAQLEAGSFATSYIPTTTASLARSADVCSITGAAFSGFYNQPEGTLFADARVEAAARSANGFLASLYGAVNIEFALRIFGNQNQVIVRDGTAKDFNVGVNATNMKIAAAYSSLNNVASMNGGAIATGTASSLPAMTAFSIGLRTGSTQQINGTISAIRYYKKRLSNQKLQALTV